MGECIIPRRGFPSWEGSVPEYRYIKLTITKLRGTPSTTQMSEFQLLDDTNTRIAFSTGITISANYSGNIGETIDKLIDNSVDTKYCTSHGASTSNPVIVTIDLGSGNILPVNATYYCYYTANDHSERDPVSWLLEMSVDGVNYDVIDTVSNATITTSRKTLAYTGVLDL